MRKILIGFLMFMTVTLNISAQDLNLPGLTSPKDAKLVDVGKVTRCVEQYLVKDSLTGKQDTVYVSVPEVVWQSESMDMHQSARASRRATATKMEGTLNEFFENVSFYVFQFNYSSVNSQGQPVTLSGIAAVPDPKNSSEVNNVLIGTHITITADKERPSNQTGELNASSDWSVLFAMAADKPVELDSKLNWAVVGGTLLSYFLLGPVYGGVVAGATTTGASARVINGAGSKYRNNFVVMPDYEGYGVSKTNAHPYLYQELTARQVVDATEAALFLYKYDTGLKDIHLNFREDWKTVICGYSQGGSVAMATQRFMEQNHIDEKFNLVGSICGDGPYDPMSTLMYYVNQDKEEVKPMSMPVVLPLIVKGMIDSNPYMRSHKVEDYFTPKFLETGIMDWLNNKEMTTGNIEDAFKNLYANGKDGNKEYYRDLLLDNGSAMMRNIMNAQCYEYFTDIYNMYKDSYTSEEGIPLPDKRGVMEDLHLALASNDITDGWQPKHHMLLFHSYDDTTVPFDNAERAEAKLGDWVVLHPADLKNDHVDSGKDFFAGDGNINVVWNNSLRITQAMEKLIDLPSKGQTAGMIEDW